MTKRCLPLILLACWLTLAATARAQDGDDSPVGGEGLEVGFDFLWSWMKGDFFPAMATVGSSKDAVPGALGQPNTAIILGNRDIDHGEIDGGRVRLVYWINSDRTLSVEGNFFLLEQQTFVFNTSGDGSSFTQVLAKPFFNPVTNQEDAALRSSSGDLAGNVNFNYTTRLMGAELNGRWFLAGDNVSDGPSISILAGARWLTLQEKYTSAETVIALPAGTGATSFISDDFATFNQFFAGQLGLQLKYRWDSNLTFDVQGKIAAGPNLETLKINGFSSVLGSTGTMTTGNQGLYAQPSNIGQHDHTIIAFMPEGSANFGWEPFSWLKLQVGYTFMYLNRVIRPGESIDRAVNIQPVGATQQIGPAQPVASFNQVGFWVQFVNLGVGFTF